MRTVNEIRNKLKNDSDFYNFHEVNNCINTGLAQLWNDEEVVDVLIISYSIDNNVLLMLTNRNRVIWASEYKETKKGRLLDSYYYVHGARVYDMTDTDSNKCRCVERSTGGFFGTTRYDIIFEGQKVPFTITVDKKSQVERIKNAVLNNAKRYGSPKAAPAVANTATSSGSGSQIAEIRKMYEDGIISKEEMLDLIKSLK